MSYIILVLCHNEIHYIKLFDSKLDAEAQAILLSNEWYKKDGVKAFAPNGIKSTQEMREYYQSQPYFNSGDAVNICVEELPIRISYGDI